eukprot:7363409-Ditylum_brightwellii.AAC.1
MKTNFFFTTKGNEARYHQAPSHEQGTTKFILFNGTYQPVSILSVSISDDNEPYTVQEHST